jgi:hypothetical protein
MNPELPPVNSDHSSGWGVFNPTSKEFHEAEDVFYHLEWHQQLAVVAAAILGGIILPIVGAFPAFCWVAQWIKPGSNTEAHKVTTVTENIFPENSSGNKSRSSTQPQVTRTSNPQLQTSGAQEQNVTTALTSSTTHPQLATAPTQPEPQKPLQPELSTPPTQSTVNPSLINRIANALMPTPTKAKEVPYDGKKAYSEFVGHPPPSVTFSEEIKKKFNIPWIFTRKCTDDKRFEPLINFLKSITFNPPIDFKNLTTLELLMTAMQTAQGNFMRSDGKNATYEEPLIQVRTLEMLDPLVVKLFQDESLSKLFRQEIREDYIYRMGCLFEHATRAYVNQKNAGEKNACRDSFQKIRDDFEQISIAEPLKFFINASKGQTIPKSLSIKMEHPDSHMGSHRWSYALSGLGFKTEYEAFLRFISKLLPMMESTGNSLVPGLLMPKLDPGKYLDKEGYRMAQSLLEIYKKDKESFQTKFETCFPGEDFEKYRSGLVDHYHNLNTSPNPKLFELPLLAEALRIKIDCYEIDKDGNFNVEHIGPKDILEPTIKIAINKEHPTSGYYLSS